MFYVFLELYKYNNPVPGRQEVTGSTPVFSTINRNWFCVLKLRKVTQVYLSDFRVLKGPYQ